ncbi:hypothetical protein [Yoonia vestfoldensis]|uniref:Uncharacterized protein n=1 Tax=Yoonia vestfoldensis TaxID=245188 RepID=A0A1Y0EGT3_9RHOB|nr:hypothetical protein [Yoonia vestfoldensis]ARU02658.1 hypothetical protein LOKVESSMR4R_03386 [Yoonia vestfoldensis]
MTRYIADHPDMIAARANAEIRAKGITDLRFDTPVFQSRRTASEAVPSAPQATPTPAAGPTPAEALRTRLGAVLRNPTARGKTEAAFSLALRTDMTAMQINGLLRDLPAGADLGLPPRAIADAAAKAEADRIRQIVTADAAADHVEQALVLALETDTPVAAALAILKALPPRMRIASIEERLAGEAEFGPCDISMEEATGARSGATGWAKAVQEANSRFEAAAPATLKDEHKLSEGGTQ